jgi:hypothetical protein
LTPFLARQIVLTYNILRCTIAAQSNPISASRSYPEPPLLNHGDLTKVSRDFLDFAIADATFNAKNPSWKLLHVPSSPFSEPVAT